MNWTLHLAPSCRDSLARRVFTLRTSAFTVPRRCPFGGVVSVRFLYRFSILLISATYKSLFPQVMCFHNPLRCRRWHLALSRNFRTRRPPDLQLFCFLGAPASCPSLCRKFHPCFVSFQQLTDTFLQRRGVGTLLRPKSERRLSEKRGSIGGRQGDVQRGQGSGSGAIRRAYSAGLVNA